MSPFVAALKRVDEQCTRDRKIAILADSLISYLRPDAAVAFAESLYDDFAAGKIDGEVIFEIRRRADALGLGMIRAGDITRAFGGTWKVIMPATPGEL